MADNVAITAGTGTTVAADEVIDGTLGTVKVQFVKLMDGTLDGTSKALVDANGLAVGVSASGGVGSLTEAAPATDTASSGLNGRAQRIAQRITSLIALFTAGPAAKAAALPVTIATDDPLLGAGSTASTGVTRPADTTAYAINDCWSDSTSAPTAGGFTLTGLGRVSGGSGVISDLIITSSIDPATLLQAEIWIFDSAVTAVNDNAAFAMSDADVLKLVGVVPFTLLSTVAGSGTNSYYWASNLNLGYTCVGTANLRYLIKVKNAYTPGNAEVLTVRAKFVPTS